MPSGFQALKDAACVWAFKAPCGHVPLEWRQGQTEDGNGAKSWQFCLISGKLKSFSNLFNIYDHSVTVALTSSALVIRHCRKNKLNTCKLCRFVEYEHFENYSSLKCFFIMVIEYVIQTVVFGVSVNSFSFVAVAEETRYMDL